MSRTISQRELRNNSAEVMDAVEGGETMIISRNGIPVAELRPIPRRALVATTELRRAWADGSRLSYAAMRDEADRLLGEDLIGD
jgi:prevent-host-death family protein